MLYFKNPTVPHSLGSVEEAFTELQYNCTVILTLNNWLLENPMIKGRTLEYGTCINCHDSVVCKAGGPNDSNANLGVVWLDDSVGALVHALSWTKASTLKTQEHCLGSSDEGLCDLNDHAVCMGCLAAPDCKHQTHSISLPQQQQMCGRVECRSD